MIKSRAAKQAERRNSDSETSLSWLEKGASDFVCPADYFKMIPTSLRGDTCPSVAWMRWAGSGSSAVQVTRICIFT